MTKRLLFDAVNGRFNRPKGAIIANSAGDQAGGGRPSRFRICAIAGIRVTNDAPLHFTHGKVLGSESADGVQIPSLAIAEAGCTGIGVDRADIEHEIVSTGIDALLGHTQNQIEITGGFQR